MSQKESSNITFIQVSCYFIKRKEKYTTYLGYSASEKKETRSYSKRIVRRSACFSAELHIDRITEHVA